MDAVSSGFSTNVNHRIFRAERERMDKRIAGIARRELNFTTNRRHTKAVAVMRDAADNAIENAPVACGFPRACFRAFHDWTESQGIKNRDRARAHRKNITQDSADTGGRTLEGFEIARSEE